MQLQERLAAIIEPTLEGLGYELVRVQVQGTKRQTLQVMADRVDGAPMAVEDCSTISRALSAVLDVEDPLPGAYNLEVSSPGIDRPLTRAKDFVAWAGFDVKLETDSLVNGRKRFSGRLMGLDEAGETVHLTSEDGEHLVPLARVSRAKLILTDELIDAVTKRFEQEH
ncbi:MAG: ribosome maturation factor RimP [Rhodospirillaceae bacterium]